MIDFLKGMVALLIDPINLLVLLSVCSLLLYWRGRFKSLKWTLFALLFSFIVCSTDPFPDLLMKDLEGKYQPLLSLVETQRGHIILVLGSGHTNDPDLPSTGKLGSTALARLTEGVRLHESMPGSRLILSGYGGDSDVSQAEVMAEAALELGVEEGNIALQSKPTNTAQEAESYLKKWGDKDPLILVTSASHMPRAMQIFRNHGLNPIPAPTFFYTKEDPHHGFDWHWFDYQNFHKVEVALHEYIGMLWERVSR